VDTFLTSLLLSFLTAVAFTPVIIAFARRRGLVDAAGASHRKVHAEDIPRLGGVAIVTGFYAPIVGLSLYSTKVGDSLLEAPDLAWGLLGGGFAIALLGLYDDLYGASPKLKLAVQLAVATWIWWLGFRIERIDLPFLPMFDLGILSLPVTLLWIAGVTNAVNLIDGLDGLAAGIALFGLVPVVSLALFKGNLLLGLIGCALSGSLLGFLVFNFHPARIFMGDTGSMFLGFVLAVTTVHTSTKGRVAVSMLMPILALGLPILDTLLAIGRRAWFGQSLFVGDRQHIHHRLMSLGLSHRNTVLVMYGVAATWALLSIAVALNRDFTSGLVLVVSVVITSVLLRKIGYLSIPASVGGEIAMVAALRERNRLVKDALPLIQARLDAHRSIDLVSAAAAELAHAAGASWARLDVLAGFPGEPVRSWEWPSLRVDDESDPREMNFPLVTRDGRRIGRLTLGWRHARTFHDGVIPRLEEGCAALAAAMPESVSAMPTPAPQTRETKTLTASA
jgi:UDP-GlcNAc:undecaprenyl-phosphate GlcNAc-1-phosphate transferase